MSTPSGSGSSRDRDIPLSDQEPEGDPHVLQCPACGGTYAATSEAAISDLDFSLAAQGVPSETAPVKCAYCLRQIVPGPKQLNPLRQQTGQPALHEAHDELKNLESMGEGNTGLAQDARREERIGVIKLAAAAAVVLGIVLLVLFH